MLTSPTKMTHVQTAADVFVFIIIINVINGKVHRHAFCFFLPMLSSVSYYLVNGMESDVLVSVTVTQQVTIFHSNATC